MSALGTQIAQTQSDARMKSVLTLVEIAPSTLTAQPEITEPFVSVDLATQEIHTAQFAAKVSPKCF